MVRLPFHTWITLCIDGLLIVLCALHVPSLIDRAKAPFYSVDDGEKVRVTEVLDSAACGGLAAGDRVLAIDGQSLPTADAVEFVVNVHHIDDLIRVDYSRLERPAVSTTVQTIPFYRVSYRIIVLLIALFTWALGIFVLLARPGDLAAGFLHAAHTCLAVILITAFEGVTPGSLTGFLSPMAFFLSYLGVATTFYILTSIFPKRRPGSLLRRSLFLGLFAAVMAAGLGFSYWHALAERSVGWFLVYNSWYDCLHISVLVLVGAGIVNFVRSFRTASTHEERRKLQWVLWGLCVGPTPFLLLNVIPELFQPTGLIQEEYTLLSMVFIPASFAISVARYHLFDIEQVIQRTTAYALVLVLLLGIYVSIVTLVASYVGKMVAGAGGAVLVALLFEPVRTRIQREVDRRFFRVRYSFREAQARFMDEVKTCMDERSVGALIVQQATAFIPVERMGFCLFLPRERRLRLLAESGFGLPLGSSISLREDTPLAYQRVPLSLHNMLEPGIVHEAVDPSAFSRWGITLLLPMLSGESAVQGFIVLGRKKSGTRFTPDDMGLLAVFAGEAGLALSRLRLQKQLFEKQLESQRLEELSNLKSDFVSYVSHELRTPLTSIKMFTELLRAKGTRQPGKAREYLDIIEGETDRLGRMVSTILDAARIDQGRKEYQVASADLGAITQKSVMVMKYQLDSQGFCVQFRRPARPVCIDADADAVADAIINLIGNAIKYSAEKKWLSVRVFRLRGQGACSVEDRGVGISADAIPRLFDKFYRDPGQSGRVKGVGLGLSVVKHVMDAHGGTIDVTSRPGRGTKFVLSFPLHQSKPSATLESTSQ
jgi:signal transduction histidine kinase